MDAIFDLKDSLPSSSQSKRRNTKSPRSFIRWLYSGRSFSILSDTDISKELFLWSILTGKRELALLFWTRGRNKICK